MTAATIPRIAVYGQAGAPYHHLSLFARNGYDVSVLFAEQIQSGALDAFDVFVIPGGGYQGMTGQLAPLGRRGAAAVSAFVRSGGMYLGSCAGAYDAADVGADFRRTCPEQSLMCLLPARVWNEAPGWRHGLRSPGVGLVLARTDSPDHPVMAGMPAEFPIVHYNGPIFTHAASLLSVAGGTDQFTPGEDFLGRQPPGPRMIGEAAAGALSLAATGQCGLGRVVLFGCHPEFGFAPGFMDDEQPPGQMLLNAVEWHRAEAAPGKHCSAGRPGHWVVAPDRRNAPKGRLESVIESIRAEVSALRDRQPDRPWLSPRYAMSVFGRSAESLWRTALAGVPPLLDEIQRAAPDLPPSMLDFTPPPGRPVDFGYAGVLPLLGSAGAMLARANADWDVDLGAPVADPYGFITTSPYHLVAGSYLAAVGRITAAALLCRCPPGRVHA